MVLIDAILKRRSIRRYTKEKLSESDELSMLEAAMCAPSAGNERPWHFLVVRDRKKLEEITGIQPHFFMLKGAPMAIIVCADQALEKYPGFWSQDCAAATENILIEAQHLGLGACWLGVYPVEERMMPLASMFDLPSGVVPFSIVAVGHPAENKSGNSRYDPTRVHAEKW